MARPDAHDRTARTPVASALLLLVIGMLGMPLVDREPALLVPPAGGVLPGVAPLTSAVVCDRQGTASVGCAFAFKSGGFRLGRDR